MFHYFTQIIKKTLNADFPKIPWLTGYLAIFVGAGMTMLVQSSSVFTSALTPLVGIGVIRLERVYPITLGSNIGTTGTGLLAAMAASGDKLPSALQIGLCHLFFNISGILIFYPIPAMRFPIRLAKMMGNTTAKYRWFAIFYLVIMFFVLPGSVFALSMIGIVPMCVVLTSFIGIVLLVILINVLQDKRPEALPKKLRNWDFLPEPLRSLDPLDRVISKVLELFTKCCPTCCCKPKSKTISIKATPSIQEPKTEISPTTITIEMLEPLNSKPTPVTNPGLIYDSGVSSYASSATTTAANSRWPSLVKLKATRL